MSSENKDRVIAGAVTFAAALLLLLVLYFSELTPGRSAMASASVPETGNDEELFIDPEFEEEELQPQDLTEAGDEPTAEEAASPSEPFSGEPDLAEEEQPQRIESGRNSKPSPPAPKPATQKKTSPVQATEPTATDRERKRATSRVANAFSVRNGSQGGSSTGAGATSGKGSGMSVAGNVSGRKFLGINKFTPTLKNKTVVRVKIVVNAAGKVIKATYSSGTSDTSLRRQCERAALTARWSESPGAADAHGTLTFTITPK